MGGHGGLNILPQKKWNVYNWDNRIKVTQNEKIVQQEIELIEKKKKKKHLDDTVKSIKNKSNKCNVSHSNDSNKCYTDQDKNKIFKQVMERESMTKKLQVDLNFEKWNTPMKSNEQLKLFDEHVDIEKINNEDVDEKKLTFKESIKNHLNPWWMKRKLEDFEIYREEIKKQNDEGKFKFLKRKHHKDKVENNKKIEKKNESNIEILRKERIERENFEKQRINLLKLKKGL